MQNNLKSLHPHELIRYMAVPGYAGVYLLGCYARHVTIYSQQVRAINLIDALCRTQLLKPETSIAVVGGGVAGLSAAAAALVRGAKVALIEQSADLCPIQSEASERYLHPHIYDWPQPSPHPTDNSRAGLPFLDWSANTGASVFKELKSDWEAVAHQLNPDVKKETRLIGIEKAGRDGHIRLDLLNQGRQETSTAQIVVLALGFGREKSRMDYQTYWQNSPLDSDQGDKLKWLVSGAGDGALTDLMRLCIPHFRHEHFIEAFAQDRDLAHQLQLLLGPQRPKATTATFEKLYPRVRDKLKFDTRKDSEVWLNAQEDYLELSGSSILNRFIVFLLQKQGAFKLRPGKLATEPEIPQARKGKYSLKFKCANDKEQSDQFDRIVIRHGPRPAISPKSLPGLHDACEKLKSEWLPQREQSEFDRTRIVAFDPADYVLRSAPNPTTAAEDEHEQAPGLRYLVVESTSQRKGLSLSDLARSALSGETYKDELKAITGTGPPDEINLEVIKVNDALARQPEYDKTVRALCRADIAIVDVTGYEPGVMLFLGIRSVARRGVTIITTNEQLTPRQWAELPFNLKDMYPLSVFGRTAGEPLRRAVASAYRQFKVTRHYQDLPAYEPARATSNEDRAIDPAQSILWLCSFSDKYAQKGYEEYIRNEVGDAFGSGGKIERVTDIVSPQLVHQRLFGAVRYRNLCVIDWTFWSSNVFYELGVRLALNRFAPVCLLAERSDLPTSPLIAEQRKHLIKLFAPIEYGLPKAPKRGSRRQVPKKEINTPSPKEEIKTPSPKEEIKTRYEAMRDAEGPRWRGPCLPTFGYLPYNHTFKYVADALPLYDEPGGIEPQEFFSNLLDALRGAHGAAKPGSPVLFANDNKTLGDNVQRTATAVAIAAWYYMQHRRSPERELDAKFVRQYQQLGDRLLVLLAPSAEAADQELADRVNRELEALQPKQDIAQ